MTSTRQNTLGVILAGGQAMRMHGDPKFLHHVGGMTILQRVARKLRQQTDNIIVNAKLHPVSVRDLSCPIIADIYPNVHGPMAGITTALHYCQQSLLDYDWILTVAADTPFFPDDLHKRMAEKISKKNTSAETPKVIFATSQGRAHPTFCLWSSSMVEEVTDLVVAKEMRKIDTVIAQFSHSHCDFAVSGHDPFFNINTYDDLLVAQELASQVSIKPYEVPTPTVYTPQP
ncbi:MAG: molybdenum cofactor guanylyltransferase [Pseudomonadota bacterium]